MWVWVWVWVGGGGSVCKWAGSSRTALGRSSWGVNLDALPLAWPHLPACPPACLCEARPPARLDDGCTPNVRDPSACWCLTPPPMAASARLLRPPPPPASAARRLQLERIAKKLQHHQHLEEQQQQLERYTHAAAAVMRFLMQHAGLPPGAQCVPVRDGTCACV